MIIFTSLGHSVGTKNLYNDGNGNYSKPKWKYNNKMFNFGKIHNLEDGIYFQNNQTILPDENKIYDENDKILELGKEHMASCKSLVIGLTKLNFNLIYLATSLNEMNNKLKLKELWKKDSSRKELILKLLNEKFNNQNKKIIYIKNKFEIKDIKKSVFERLFLYLCSKLAKSQKMSANIS